MDTFPYDSWEEALADAGPYFTGGGGNSAIVLAVLGIILSVLCAAYYTQNEDKHLNEAASRLASKYRGDN